ncbi:hypothetical protein RIF29_19984 [Crotalaria pallida]|uniref:Uncharacterized protein n=1 Tax=Crotalaria pallida TaxID=3830 RepID=A0AAN9F4R2_CROPI
MEDTHKPCGHQPLLPSLNLAIVVHVRHRHMTPIVFTKLRKRPNQSSFSFKLAAAKQPLVQICIHTVVPPLGGVPSLASTTHRGYGHSHREQILPSHGSPWLHRVCHGHRALCSGAPPPNNHRQQPISLSRPLRVL